MFFLHRIWNWCSRFRHRCGYGVHSPSDFFLISLLCLSGIEGKGISCLFATLSKESEPFAIPVG